MNYWWLDITLHHNDTTSFRIAQGKRKKKTTNFLFATELTGDFKTRQSPYRFEKYRVINDTFENGISLACHVIF